MHHFTTMLSIEKCKQILKIENEEIEDEKITKLIEMFTAIAEISVDTFMNQKIKENENSSNNEPR